MDCYFSQLPQRNFLNQLSLAKLALRSNVSVDCHQRSVCLLACSHTWFRNVRWVWYQICEIVADCLDRTCLAWRGQLVGDVGMELARPNWDAIVRTFVFVIQTPKSRSAVSYANASVNLYEPSVRRMISKRGWIHLHKPVARAVYPVNTFMIER